MKYFENFIGSQKFQNQNVFQVILSNFVFPPEQKVIQIQNYLNQNALQEIMSACLSISVHLSL